jgi:hypothetical protein
MTSHLFLLLIATEVQTWMFENENIKKILIP